MTLQTLMYAAAKVSDEMRETIKANPDKVYFPNFGSSDNILKRGITIDRVMFTIPARILRYTGTAF